MKAAVYYNNRDVRIEEMPIPRIGGGEILVRVEASGICGSDVMEWYRIKKAPRVLGHEIAGVITEVGKGVTRFKEGDRVFVSHHVPCMICKYCLISAMLEPAESGSSCLGYSATDPLRTSFRE